MLCGLPLSGKTVYSKELEKQTGFKRLSLDEEYFKVAGNNQKEYRDFDLEKQVEEKLKQEIVEYIRNGKSLILDYCPWQKNRREEYKKLIEDNGGIRKLLYFSVPIEELKRRIGGRNKLEHKHYQFITPSMLDDFVKKFEIPKNEGEEIF